MERRVKGIIHMFAYRNTEKVRKTIDKLYRKGHLRKNPDTGEFELTKKGVKICKKKGVRIAEV